jgi:hypothetical protein
MNTELKSGLDYLRTINPELECQCWRALSAVNFCREAECDEKFIAMLEEAAVYGVLRAHLGQDHIGSDFLRDAVGSQTFGKLCGEKRR